MKLFCFFQPNYTAIINTCNLWRNFDDIQDSWSSVASVIDYYGDNQDVIIANAGPGHWNDPDMVRKNFRSNLWAFKVLQHHHAETTDGVISIGGLPQKMMTQVV